MRCDFDLWIQKTSMVVAHCYYSVNILYALKTGFRLQRSRFYWFYILTNVPNRVAITDLSEKPLKTTEVRRTQWHGIFRSAANVSRTVFHSTQRAGDGLLAFIFWEHLTFSLSIIITFRYILLDRIGKAVGDCYCCRSDSLYLLLLFFCRWRSLHNIDSTITLYCDFLLRITSSG